MPIPTLKTDPFDHLPARPKGFGKNVSPFPAPKPPDLIPSDGTRLGFLGPNGTGKTTPIKIMTSLIRSTRGRAFPFAAAATAFVVTGITTWEMGLSHARALAYMTAAVGLPYILSATLKTTIPAAVLTFFLFAPMFNILGGILTLASLAPWFIPASASGIITTVLSPPEMGGPEPGGGFSFSPVPDVTMPVAVLAGYALSGSFLAAVLFRRKEAST